MTLNCREPKEIFLKRLSDHAESSQYLNFFTATIQDYGIILKPKQGEMLVRNRFGRRNFFLTIVVSETHDGCIIHISVKPTWGNMITSASLLLFILICPFQFAAKVAFAGVLFTIELIALAFYVWWTKDLFQKQVVKNRQFS